MVCLSRPYHFNFLKGCLPKILFGPFLNTLNHFFIPGIQPNLLELLALYILQSNRTTVWLSQWLAPARQFHLEFHQGNSNSQHILWSTVAHFPAYSERSVQTVSGCSLFSSLTQAECHVSPESRTTKVKIWAQSHLQNCQWQ